MAYAQSRISPGHEGNQPPVSLHESCPAFLSAAHLQGVCVRIMSMSLLHFVGVVAAGAAAWWLTRNESEPEGPFEEETPRGLMWKWWWDGLLWEFTWCDYLQQPVWVVLSPTGKHTLTWSDPWGMTPRDHVTDCERQVPALHPVNRALAHPPRSHTPLVSRREARRRWWRAYWWTRSTIQSIKGEAASHHLAPLSHNVMCSGYWRPG